MSDCGVGMDLGTMTAGAGWRRGKFLKYLRDWDEVGYKLCGNGWGWGSLCNPEQASSGITSAAMS